MRNFFTALVFDQIEYVMGAFVHDLFCAHFLKCFFYSGNHAPLSYSWSCFALQHEITKTNYQASTRQCKLSVLVLGICFHTDITNSCFTIHIDKYNLAALDKIGKLVLQWGTQLKQA